EQVSHRLCVAEVVDRNDLEVATALEVSPEKVPPNPPESVDAYTCLGHDTESKGGCLERAPCNCGRHLHTSPLRRRPATRSTQAAGRVDIACDVDIERPCRLAGAAVLRPNGPPRAPRRRRAASTSLAMSTLRGRAGLPARPSSARTARRALRARRAGGEAPRTTFPSG